jgi:hypothetical protein
MTELFDSASCLEFSGDASEVRIQQDQLALHAHLIDLPIAIASFHGRYTCSIS